MAISKNCFASDLRIFVRKITTKNVKHAKVQKRVYKLSTNVEFLEVALVFGSIVI